MAGNAMWHLIMQSDAVSKLVMVVLLGMSIACWTIFLYKVILFRIKIKQIEKALTAFVVVDTFDKLIEQIQTLRGTIPGYFLAKNVQFLKSLVAREQENVLAPRSVAMLEQHIDQTIDDLVRTQELYVPFLSTSAAVAPLLGLFGTVWGLVHSFIRISEQQSADIATVAPGIAEALMTTLAGLVVAIPAVLLFNMLASYVKHLEQKLVRLADFFMTRVYVEFGSQQ